MLADRRMVGHTERSHYRYRLFSLPTCCKVFPLWIDRLNQVNLLRAQPTLDVLLTLDSGCDIMGFFVIDQNRQVVLAGEPLDQLLLVLVDATLQVVCNADVQCMRAIGHQIDKVVMRHLRCA